MNPKTGGVVIKEVAVKVLDERELELIEALEAVGVKRNVATIIVHLTYLGEATSKEIETRSGLRQPEVSIAMSTLRKHGWIAERDIKKGEKGRPTMLYEITVSIEDIIEYYEKEKRSEIIQVMQSIQKLKRISAT
jgi:predicted transcriptional regulator